MQQLALVEVVNKKKREGQCSSRKLSERNHYGVIQVCKVNTTRNVKRRV